jgi:hypothetical protein
MGNIIMKSINNIIKALFVALTITACGGGGGTDNSGAGAGAGAGAGTGGTGGTTNLAPVSNAGNDQTVLEGTLVTIQGSGTDSDGSIIAHSWQQVAGTLVMLNNANSSEVSFVAPMSEGELTLSFELTVTDNNGAATKDAINIFVTPNDQPNVAPIANAGLDQAVDEKVIVNLNGSATDSDGIIVGYSWTQVSGTAVIIDDADKDTASFIAPATAKHLTLTFSLEVTDNENAVDSDVVNIAILPLVAAAGTNKLNDTGIVNCGDRLSNDLSCPVDGFAEQDAEQGRDAMASAGLLVKKGAGKAGFDFTKIDVNGNELTYDASDWACVLDNVTGLYWEVKTQNQGLHYFENTYTWYNSDETRNGGSVGFEDGGSCSESACDTQALVMKANEQSFCGYTNWRLPDREELRSILDYSIKSPLFNKTPMLDSNYFPYVQNQYHWTANPSVANKSYAWGIHLNFARDGSFYEQNTYAVMLVRADK